MRHARPGRQSSRRANRRRSGRRCGQERRTRACAPSDHRRRDTSRARAALPVATRRAAKVGAKRAVGATNRFAKMRLGRDAETPERPKRRLRDRRLFVQKLDEYPNRRSVTEPPEYARHRDPIDERCGVERARESIPCARRAQTCARRRLLRWSRWRDGRGVAQSRPARARHSSCEPGRRGRELARAVRRRRAAPACAIALAASDTYLVSSSNATRASLALGSPDCPSAAIAGNVRKKLPLVTASSSGSTVAGPPIRPSASIAATATLSSECARTARASGCWHDCPAARGSAPRRR